MIWELSHNPGNHIHGILTNRQATETMCEQMFGSLVPSLSKKRLYGKVHYLLTDISQLKPRAPGNHDPTSDWGEVGPVSVLTRIDRDWDWVKAR